jgi:AcrR family transcriptional regulator
MNKRPLFNSQPPNRFERRKQQTRNQLRQATLELVLEKGFDAVTIQDIVERADQARGTFYIHYKDKQDILWDIIEEGLRASLEEGAKEARTEPQRPGYVGYRITFETAAKHQDLYRVMLGSQGSALVTHQAADYLAGAMREGIEAGQYLSNLDFPPDILTQYAIGALMRLTIWWLETPNDYTPRQMADMLYALIHGHSPTSPG